jgi:hypothetical protein
MHRQSPVVPETRRTVVSSLGVSGMSDAFHRSGRHDTRSNYTEAKAVATTKPWKLQKQSRRLAALLFDGVSSQGWVANKTSRTNLQERSVPPCPSTIQEQHPAHAYKLPYKTKRGTWHASVVDVQDHMKMTRQISETITR